MFDAEALFFVDDDEAEVFEGDVFGDEPVGADDDVDGAGEELFGDLAGFGGGAEAVEDIDADRVIRHAFAEIVIVLLGEDGGGCEDGDLFS